SPDIEVIALAQSNRVAFCDSATGKLLWERLMKGGAIRYVAFHPKTDRAAVLARDEGYMVNRGTGKAVFPPLKFSVISMCAAFSPDGELLATASGDEFVLEREAIIWDAGTGRPITPPMEHNGAISSVIFSPDNRRLATASHDRTARIWDARTGQPLTPPLRHASGVSYACFGPDSRWLATFSEDGAARLW